MIILLCEEKMNGQADTLALLNESAVEVVVARIQQLGASSTHITPASGLLGQHLLELMQESDPTFDLEQWQKEWEQIEATMEAEETAHEQAEWRSL